MVFAVRCSLFFFLPKDSPNPDPLNKHSQIYSVQTHMVFCVSRDQHTSVAAQQYEAAVDTNTWGLVFW